MIGVIDLHAKYGFKYLHILACAPRKNDTRFGDIDAMAEAFEYADSKGIKIMLWTGYYHKIYENQKLFAEWRKKLDLPNIIAQLVIDEPELSISSGKCLAFLRKMHPLFPYHPVMMNNSVLAIPNRFANLETDILMIDDYLTNRENRSVASVVNQVDGMIKAGKAEGKPAYYFLVGCNFPLHYRVPSYAEQIAQTYGVIAAGCTGVSYFYGSFRTPENWKAVLQLNREIMSLNDILLSGERIAQGSFAADPKLLRNLTRKHKGYVYVISCNIDPNPMNKVTFTLPAGLKYADSAEVLFENRKVPVKDGKFTDSFPGHFRHVYKIKIKK